MTKKSETHERPLSNLTYNAMKEALPKLDRNILSLNEFDIKTIHNGQEPSLHALASKTSQLITEIFGNKSHEYYQYHSYSQFMSRALDHPTGLEIRQRTQIKLKTAISVLTAIKESFLEKLCDADLNGTHNNVIKAYEGLELHPEIARASSKLFRDAHYANAIEDGVKALNNLVRLRSNIDDDGVSLMQKAFSQKNPRISFNALTDESDRNEQKGFMDLFTGAVTGLRNPRAHKIIQDDPEMALEFIAFISLLAKLIDKATLK